MRFSIRPYRRFPVQCSVMYNAGPFRSQGTGWNRSRVVVCVALCVLTVWRQVHMGWIRRLLGEKVLATRPEVSTVDVLGHSLKCQVCRHDQFWRHEVLLNTRTLTFFDIEWMNRDATCVICERCGYVHWFVSTTTPEWICSATPENSPWRLPTQTSFSLGLVQTPITRDHVYQRMDHFQHVKNCRDGINSRTKRIVIKQNKSE